MAAFNGNLGQKFVPRPPEKGSFPIDHLQECTDFKEIYMDCLKKNKHKIEPCRVFARDYLFCRQNNELMAKESVERLGFADLRDVPTHEKVKAPP